MVCRRAAASICVLLAKYSRKPELFAVYLFKALMSGLVPGQGQTSGSGPGQTSGPGPGPGPGPGLMDQIFVSIPQILGNFLALKQLLGCLGEFLSPDYCPQSKKFTVTGILRVNLPQPLKISKDEIAQFLEVAIFFLSHANSSVNTAALEVLAEGLKCGSKGIFEAFLDPEGLQKLRIGQFFPFPTTGRHSRTSSKIFFQIF